MILVQYLNENLWNEAKNSFNHVCVPLSLTRNGMLFSTNFFVVQFFYLAESSLFINRHFFVNGKSLFHY